MRYQFIPNIIPSIIAVWMSAMSYYYPLPYHFQRKLDDISTRSQQGIPKGQSTPIHTKRGSIRLGTRMGQLCPFSIKIR